MSCIRLLRVMVGSDTKYYKPMRRTPLENRFAKRGCLRAYKYMVKLILNPYP